MSLWGAPLWRPVHRLVQWSPVSVYRRSGWRALFTLGMDWCLQLHSCTPLFHHCSSPSPRNTLAKGHIWHFTRGLHVSRNKPIIDNSTEYCVGLQNISRNFLFWNYCLGIFKWQKQSIHLNEQLISKVLFYHESLYWTKNQQSKLG